MLGSTSLSPEVTFLDITSSSLFAFGVLGCAAVIWLLSALPFSGVLLHLGRSLPCAQKTVSMQEVKPAFPFESYVSLPCGCQGSVTVALQKAPLQRGTGYPWGIMYLQLLPKSLSTLNPVLAYRFIYLFFQLSSDSPASPTLHHWGLS